MKLEDALNQEMLDAARRCKQEFGYIQVHE